MIVQMQSPTDFATQLGPNMNLNVQWPIIDFFGSYINQTLHNPLGIVQQVNVVQNNTTFFTPSGSNIASLVVIIPPAGNTQAWQLKGNVADLGTQMTAALPAAIGLNQTIGLIGVGIGLAAGTDKLFTLVWL